MEQATRSKEEQTGNGNILVTDENFEDDVAATGR